MRVVLATVAGALVLALSGCSSEAGPTPAPQPRDPGIEGLRVKLDALSVDLCYATPDRQAPKGCEKYITQLGSTVGTIRKIAGTAHDPTLAAEAAKLDKGIAAYREHACNTVTTPGGPCTAALTDIARTLRAIHDDLEAPAASR